MAFPLRWGNLQCEDGRRIPLPMEMMISPSRKTADFALSVKVFMPILYGKLSMLGCMHLGLG
jgi:hypothetical protein